MSKRRRRWFRTPESNLQELRRLLLETELSAQECLRQAGIPTHGGKGSKPDQVIKECRRYVRSGQWVNRVTGKLCPEICTMVCAADKTGLSTKTIHRHVQRGFVQPGVAPSHQGLPIFSDDDVALLAEIGRLKSGGPGVLSAEDVEAIRELAAAGRTARDIWKRYPVVQLKQIRRIISGERWRRLT